MKNRSTIIMVIFALVAAGGYVLLKKRPIAPTEFIQTEKSGHPPIQAPGFELLNISGDKVSLTAFEGKAVVINFFATWCPPCRTEIPFFVKVYNQFRSQGFEIIGIALDSDAKEVLPGFIDEHNITYSVAIGTQDIITKYGGVQSVPTTFFINRSGEITNVHMGFIDEETFKKEAEKIL